MTQPPLSLRRRIRAKCLPYVLKVVAFFPLKILYPMAAFIAALAYYFPNSIRTIAKKNIALAFPNTPPQAQQQLLKVTLVHNVITIFELCFIWLSPFDRTKKHIAHIVHDKSFDEDLKKHQQMIFITPHLGSWEISGLYASSLLPLVTLYRPSRLGIDRLVVEGRAKNGAVLVPTTTNGIRDMIKAMKKGHSVGILPDQDPGSGEGIFSPFFGVQTKTIVLVSRLAQRFKIPAYLVITRRDLKSTTFTINVSKIDDQLADPDLQRSVDTLNKAVETAIAPIPEQYLWTYKRFKTPPEGEPPRY